MAHPRARPLAHHPISVRSTTPWEQTSASATKHARIILCCTTQSCRALTLRAWCFALRGPAQFLDLRPRPSPWAGPSCLALRAILIQSIGCRNRYAISAVHAIIAKQITIVQTCSRHIARPQGHIELSPPRRPYPLASVVSHTPCRQAGSPGLFRTTIEP
jgi:hypothetical protein